MDFFFDIILYLKKNLMIFIIFLDIRYNLQFIFNVINNNNLKK